MPTYLRVQVAIRGTQIAEIAAQATQIAAAPANPTATVPAPTSTIVPPAPSSTEVPPSPSSTVVPSSRDLANILRSAGEIERLGVPFAAGPDRWWPTMTTINGTTTVVGRIARCNDRGVLLDGEDEWRNVSKFADSCPDPKQFDGGNIELTLDGQGYIREITEAQGEPPTPTVRAESVPSDDQATTEPLSRDVMIARHVALKAAVELLANDITTQPDPTITTALATTFEEWLLRK